MGTVLLWIWCIQDSSVMWMSWCDIVEPQMADYIDQHVGASVIPHGLTSLIVMFQRYNQSRCYRLLAWSEMMVTLPGELPRARVVLPSPSSLTAKTPNLPIRCSGGSHNIFSCWIHSHWPVCLQIKNILIYPAPLGMVLESHALPTLCEIPKLDRLLEIIRTRYQQSAVGWDANIINPMKTINESLAQLARWEVPKPDRLVRRTRCQQLTIGWDSNRGNDASMALKSLQFGTPALIQRW